MSLTRVSPPPSMTTERLWVRAIATGALFIALAGDAIRNFVGMPGFSVIAIIFALACGYLLLRLRPRPLHGPWPWSLGGYVLFALASILWSAYPSASALTWLGVALCTVVGLFLALVATWGEIVAALSRALKAILALSLAFELFVSLVLRAPLLPLGQDLGPNPPLLSYWSRNELFGGDRIQGIVGNANLLGFVATLGIIVFTLEYFAHRDLPPALRARATPATRTLLWLALAVLLFILTRSSTMILALGACVLVVIAVRVVRSREQGPARRKIYLILGATAVILGLAAIILRDTVLGLLGKNSDLTGRSEIWDVVSELARERPIAGQGFASPWVPWVAPFDHLVTRNGVLQLQAHNAWLDVWMQLGIIGVILLAAVLLPSLWRSWFMAVDRPRIDLRTDRPYTALSMLPLLILVVLLVQSFAESRPLIEAGWVLITLIAVASKRRPLMDAGSELAPEARDAVVYHDDSSPGPGVHPAPQRSARE